MSLFVFFISLLIVAQHFSGNHVPTIRSWRLRDVIASCWYVPWLQEGCQDHLAVDVTFCILYFSSNSCSTCFRQPCAHHQELTTAWCYSLVLVCAVAAGRLSRLLYAFSLLIVAQHVSGNRVPIIRRWRLRDVIASCWYVPWLQGGCQDRLAGSASIWMGS